MIFARMNLLKHEMPGCVIHQNHRGFIMTTVYEHLVACDQKQAADKPKLIEGINQILAKFPKVKHRIIPEKNKSATGNNNLLHAVMNLDTDVLSGLAKPGFLGFFSKLGNLGPGLALMGEYKKFLEALRDKTKINDDVEYFTALQEVINYLQDKQKNTFLQHLAKIEHVGNFLGIISSDLEDIWRGLNTKRQAIEMQKLQANLLLFKAKAMEPNTNPKQNIEDMKKIAKDIDQLKFVKDYHKEEHQAFITEYVTALRTHLSAHVGAVGKNSLLSTKTLQEEADYCQQVENELLTLQDQPEIRSSKNLGFLQHINAQCKEVHNLVKVVEAQYRDKYQTEQAAAHALKNIAAEAKAADKLESKSGKSGPGRNRDAADEKEDKNAWWNKTETRTRRA